MPCSPLPTPDARGCHASCLPYYLLEAQRNYPSRTTPSNRNTPIFLHLRNRILYLGKALILDQTPWRQARVVREAHGGVAVEVRKVSGRYREVAEVGKPGSI